MSSHIFIAEMDKIRVDAFLVTNPDAEDYKTWKTLHPDSVSVPCRWVRRERQSSPVSKASHRHDPFEPPSDDHGRGADPDERPMRPLNPLNPLPRGSTLPESMLPPFPVLRPPLWAPRAPSAAPSGPARGPGGASAAPSGRPGEAVPAGDLDPATPEERRRLRAVLERLGKIAPGQQAHHIVPGGGAMSGGRDPAA